MNSAATGEMSLVSHSVLVLTALVLWYSDELAAPASDKMQRSVKHVLNR